LPGEKTVKQLLKLAAVSMVAALCFGAAKAEDKVTPKPEDAERNAFQMHPTEQQDAKEKQTKSHANPESRLNDDPPAHEKVGKSNNPGK
jgi:hypothetical protein